MGSHDEEKRMVITSLAQITPEWLTAALQPSGVMEGGRVSSVAVEANERSTAVTAFLEPRYTPGTPPTAPPRLFLKLGGRRGEVIFHTQIAPEMGEDAPVLHCYEAVHDGKHQQVLLDDASDSHAAPPELLAPPQADVESMLDALATVHACWWEHPRLSRDLGEINHEADSLGFIYRRTVEAFPGFVDFMGDRLSAERRTLYERMLSKWPPAPLTARLKSRRMVTLNHGDSHAQNYLLPRRRGMGKVLLIDWSDWRIAPGPFDAAFLMAMEWYPERRARLEQPLVRYYFDRLLEKGVTGYDWEQCWLDYRMGAAFNLLMPVFWYTWSPPQFWWHPLETAAQAYQDLRCEELLS